MGTLVRIARRELYLKTNVEKTAGTRFSLNGTPKEKGGKGS